MIETLNNNNYQLLEEIGRGRFGTVYRCFSPMHGPNLACKIINKNLLTDSTDRECLENEPKIMTLLGPHPNILRIFDLYENDDFLAMVVELCEPETLYDQILEKTTLFTEHEAALVMKSLLEAIAHCHQQGVVHRDVKPDNILFDSRQRLKLADFGSAEWLGDEGTTSGVVGTPYYVAPEVLAGREYGKKVDVWSAGIVLYIMLSGVPPFYGESAQEVFEAVLRGNLRFPPKLFGNVSSEAKDFMRKMMCKEVSRRLSAEQALRHPWILNEGEMSSAV